MSPARIHNVCSSVRPFVCPSVRPSIYLLCAYAVAVKFFCRLMCDKLKQRENFAAKLPIEEVPRDQAEN